MVVFFPPSTYTRRRRDLSSDSDDDEAGARYYYVRLEAVSSSSDEDDDDDDQRPPTAKGRRPRRHNHNHRHARLILEVPDEEESDGDYYTDEEEEESDEWDPCLHLDELPLRPMSRFHKAFIDVLFVVATVAAAGVFVWTTAMQQAGGADKVVNWILSVPLMLPVVVLILCLAVFVYLLVTRDFSWRPAPDAPPADEKV